MAREQPKANAQNPSGAAVDRHLAAIGVLNSVVSMLYMTEGATEIEPLKTRLYLVTALLISALATILVGIFPSLTYDLASVSFASLGR